MKENVNISHEINTIEDVTTEQIKLYCNTKADKGDDADSFCKQTLAALEKGSLNADWNESISEDILNFVIEHGVEGQTGGLASALDCI